MAEIDALWAKIEGEYVNTSITLKEIAAKYGVPLGNVQKVSAKRKWSEKRKKYAERKAEKVAERLNDKDIKQTVRDIDRVCKAAGKLIDAANKAIRQLDKQSYMSFDDIEQVQENVEAGDITTTKTTKKRKLRMAQAQTLVDTKRMCEIAKTLLNIKDILVSDDGQPGSNDGSGVIEITAADTLDARPEGQ